MAQFDAAAATGAISSRRERQTSEEDERHRSDLRGGGGAGRGRSQTQIVQSSSGSCGGAEGGSGGGGGGAEGGSGTVEVAVKPRGRPPGSKNKQKPPITRDNENAMIPRILEVAAGCDIGLSVLDFVQRTQMGLCVMYGSGTVASVVLRRAIVPASSPLMCGGELLSISGMYLPVSSSNSSSFSWTGGLTISLAVAGSQGKVVGGSVIGEFIAARPVTIIAASFTNPQLHRMPAEVDEEYTANTNQGAMAASTVHGNAPPNDSGGAMATIPSSDQI